MLKIDSESCNSTVGCHFDLRPPVFFGRHCTIRESSRFGTISGTPGFPQHSCKFWDTWHVCTFITSMQTETASTYWLLLVNSYHTYVTTPHSGASSPKIRDLSHYFRDCRTTVKIVGQSYKIRDGWHV
jgi:hypothetical protein